MVVRLLKLNNLCKICNDRKANPNITYGLCNTCDQWLLKLPKSELRTFMKTLGSEDHE